MALEDLASEFRKKGFDICFKKKKGGALRFILMRKTRTKKTKREKTKKNVCLLNGENRSTF